MKRQLKQQILQKRNSITKEEVTEKSSRIKRNLYSLQEFKQSKNMLFYVSINNEVDTQEIIKELLIKKEKTIIVPYAVKNNPILQLSEIKGYDELEAKTFNILEPKSNSIREFDPDKLDLVIIPGMVFDKSGHRIGYGYGYFDRFLTTLKNNVKKIGLAFDFQLVDKIPKEEHDVPMDTIITENQIINCDEK